MVCSTVSVLSYVNRLYSNNFNRGIVKIMKHIKIRTYSPNDVYGTLVNPLRRQISIENGSDLLNSLQDPCSYGDESV